MKDQNILYQALSKNQEIKLSPDFQKLILKRIEKKSATEKMASKILLIFFMCLSISTAIYTLYYFIQKLGCFSRFTTDTLKGISNYFQNIIFTFSKINKDISFFYPIVFIALFLLLIDYLLRTMWKKRTNQKLVIN